MGLDMYLFKAETFDGYNYKQLSGMKEQLEFVNSYEDALELSKDFDGKYDERYYWNYVGETPEEKKERIRKSLEEFIKTDRGRYSQLKDKYDTAFKERLSNFTHDEVGYWRKANQIHAWFVDNVQNKIDDCGYYEVSKESLKELYDACQRILISVQEVIDNDERYAHLTVREFIDRNESLSELKGFDELDFSKDLPTRDGFFFGGTNYDIWYLYDIVQTVDILIPILEEEQDNNIVYIYHSSW